MRKGDEEAEEDAVCEHHPSSFLPLKLASFTRFHIQSETHFIPSKPHDFRFKSVSEHTTAPSAPIVPALYFFSFHSFLHGNDKLAVRKYYSCMKSLESSLVQERREREKMMRKQTEEKG